MLSVKSPAEVPSAFESTHISENSRKIGTYLLYFYLFMIFVRAQNYVPPLAALRVVGISGLLLSVWTVFNFKFHLLKNPTVIVLLLAILFGISGIGARNVSAYRMSIDFFTIYYAHALAIFILVDTKVRFLRFISFWCLVYFLVAVITILNGGRGPGDFLLDENDVALLLTMALPFVFYASQILKLRFSLRLLLWVFMAAIIMATVVSASRGGFLGLVGVILVIWWFAKNRIKIAVTFLLIALVSGGAIVAFLPDDYYSEITSINNSEDETRVERLRTWEIAWLMYKDKPIIGVGSGNFPFNVSTYQPLTDWYMVESTRSLQGRLTHSLYFQIISELGTIGALVYLYILIWLPLKLYKVRNRPELYGENSELAKYFSQALIAGIAAYMVCGAFISVAYYPHIPLWISMYALLDRILKQKRSSSGENEIVANKQSVF